MSGKTQSSSDSKSLLASESGSFRKKWKGKVPVALIFPNSYHLGMSNLGFQLVLQLLNSHSDIVCERFFRSGGQLLSLESERPLKDFPVLLFSVSFEHDFLGVVEMLHQGGIEPFASRRRAGQKPVLPGNPLIGAGGVATFINPEPLAPFIDFFLLGELESVADPFIAFLIRFVSGAEPRSLLLEMAATLRGSYVPEFYTPGYNGSGILSSVVCEPGVPVRVKKNMHAGGESAGHSCILSSATEFANIHLVELGRGCSRSCRFCAAGYVYRPPRRWSSDAIIAAIKKRPEVTRKIGLLGMEMVSPEELQRVSRYLLKEECSLSFSSLRADIIDAPLLSLLASSNLKSAAIAPDGGSERLRRVINKGITEDDCLMAAESLVKAGITNLKLYFMIGLPTEEEEDLHEMVKLVAAIQRTILAVGRSKGRFSRIVLSINTFVPKAWTPLQYHPFCSLAAMKNKMKFLRKQFASFHNLRLSFDKPSDAYFQATLARGDRRVGQALHAVMLSPKNWRHAFADAGIDSEFYAMRQRESDELFPWDVVDHGIDKRYLWKEYQLALQGKVSQGCEIDATHHCKRCGVCHD